MAYLLKTIVVGTASSHPATGLLESAVRPTEERVLLHGVLLRGAGAGQAPRAHATKVKGAIRLRLPKGVNRGFFGHADWSVFERIREVIELFHVRARV